MKKILVLMAYFICLISYAQEGSVGIGTQTPSEKAVLHLVAPQNDQGFLVPKMTTAQKTSFGAGLTANENGMLVYDTDANQFFFWLSDHWEEVGSSLQAGNGIDITNGVITNSGDTDASDDFSGDWTDLANVPAGFTDGTDEVDDADADPENELQDLTISGDVLTITGLTAPTSIDLSPYAGTNTDEQDLQFTRGKILLTGDPDNTIIDLSGYDDDVSDDFSGSWLDLDDLPAGFDDDTDDVDDADADATNEIQDISTDNNPGNISLTDGSTLNLNVDDADSDPTNEIQDISTDNSSGNISLTDGSTINLNVDDADSDPSNELELPATATTGEVLKYDGSGWVAGADLVDDGDVDATNELQDLNLESNILTITGLGSPTAINLAAFTGDNTDEQNLQFSGGIITLTGDPDGVGADLSGYDSNVSDDFSGSWNNLDDIPAGFDDDTDDVDDADNDPSNEIEFPESAPLGYVMKYNDSGTWGPAPDNVNDGDADDTNELQDLNIEGSILTIDGFSTEIDLAAFSSITPEDLDLQFSEGAIFLPGDPNPTTIDLGEYDSNWRDDFDGEWTSLNNRPEGLDDGDDVDDADSDPTNEFQTISVNRGMIVLSDGGGEVSVDDADADPNNEMQDLELVEGSLVLTNDDTAVSLSAYFDNTDLLASVPVDAGDEGAVLKYFPADGGWQVGTDFVDDDDASPTNEFQTISREGFTVTLSDGGGSFSIEDGDASSTNEIEFPATATTGYIMKFNGTSWVASPDDDSDGDTSSSNEIEFPESANDGDVMTYSSTNKRWEPTAVGGGGQYAFKAGKTTDQNIANDGKDIVLLFDEVSYDIGENYDKESSVFQVPVDGIYNFTGLISTTFDSGADLDIQIRVNGGSMHTVLASGTNAIPQDSFPFYTDLNLSEGDRVEVAVSSRSSGKVVGNVTRTNWSGRFIMGIER